MNETHRFMHNTFWVADQVSFLFKLLSFDPDKDDLNQNLNLRDFAAFLMEHGYSHTGLGDPDNTNQRVLAGAAVRSASPDSPIFYTYSGSKHSPSLGESMVTAFVHFEAQPTAPQTAGQASQDHQAHEGGTDLSSTAVARLVNLVNEHLQTLSKGEERLKDGRQLGPIPIVAAAPHWYCGASNGSSPSGQVTTGCPLTPPIPVEKECPSSPGLWPILLPKLPPELKKMTGDGVTIFVMDTLPGMSDIKRAAEAAEEHNLRLLDLVNNVTFSYPVLPDNLDRPNPHQPTTGKDIQGRAIGFRVPDHGLFIAGIIRDIAPKARVECIRVLNDFCAGSVQVLTDQLFQILQRTLVGGDLYNQDVVINLSLVIPDDEDVKTSGIDLNLARQGLLIALQSLSERGVIFAASAGNEGDRRYMKSEAHYNKEHPNALYPAAYAYPLGGQAGFEVENMIPVGAVNHKRKVSSYSCYPGLRGVSTYGGETPFGQAILKDTVTRMTQVDTHLLDAVVGVYTQLYYPALSFDDPEPTYAAPNAHGWAYWIGTSFATPIVSAVVARALELQRRTPSLNLGQPITDAIIKYAAQEAVSWPKNGEENTKASLEPMILAEQRGHQ